MDEAMNEMDKVIVSPTTDRPELMPNRKSTSDAISKLRESTHHTNNVTCSHTGTHNNIAHMNITHTQREANWR